MKKTILVILLLSFTACSSVKEKVGGLKPNVGVCPPEAERGISDIFCKEAK